MNNNVKLEQAADEAAQSALSEAWPNGYDFPEREAFKAGFLAGARYQPQREAVLEEEAREVLRLARNPGVAAGDFGKIAWGQALQRLDTALTTPAPAVSTDGWQDIETAPETSRDGVRIDVWLEPIPERQAKFMNPATEGRRLANAWFVERQDYTGFRNAHSFNGRELNWRATHWRPIPKKPAILSRLRGEGE
jgi:hypothetical protein